MERQLQEQHQQAQPQCSASNHIPKVSMRAARSTHTQAPPASAELSPCSQSQQRGLVWEFRPILHIPRAAAAPSAPAYGRKTTIRSPATPKLAAAVAGDIPATCNHGLTLNNLFSSAKPRSSRLCIITETSPGPQSCRRPASARCSALPIKHFGEVFGSDPCPRPALLQQ